MRNFFLKFFIFYGFSWFVYAADKKPPTGIGLVAENLMAPVGVLSDFVYTACFIIGGSFILASIVKYMEHKRSPLMVPISTVIFFIGWNSFDPIAIHVFINGKWYSLRLN